MAIDAMKTLSPTSKCLPTAAAARPRLLAPGLELLDDLRGLRADGGDVEDGDARLLEGGEALLDVALGAAEVGELEQLGRHRRRGLGLLAVEVEVLDLLRLRLVAIA